MQPIRPHQGVVCWTQVQLRPPLHSCIRAVPAMHAGARRRVHCSKLHAGGCGRPTGQQQRTIEALALQQHLQVLGGQAAVARLEGPQPGLHSSSNAVGSSQQGSSICM